MHEIFPAKNKSIFVQTSCVFIFALEENTEKSKFMKIEFQLFSGNFF